jgi:hypothetical protein
VSLDADVKCESEAITGLPGRLIYIDHTIPPVIRLSKGFNPDHVYICGPLSTLIM